MSRKTGNAPQAPTKALSADDPRFQKRVFTKAFEATLRLLDNPQVNDLQALLATYGGRNRQLDDAARIFAKTGNAECRAGCSSCCHQMVLCTPFEIFLIARYLLDKKSTSELDAIKARLSKLSPLPLDTDARYGRDKPCAFLENERCSIYEQRPLVCRTLLSAARNACEACLGGDDIPIPYIANVMSMAALVQMGIDYALIKCRNLSTEKVELSRALLIALNGFDAAVTIWVHGHNPFPDCIAKRPGYPSNRNICIAAAKRFGVP